ncbi:MAG TPA: S8 family serine peptidase [Blastocatellia bacterium]|nr:S8 family serine peptidase [Blastocatellia bacterium]
MKESGCKVVGYIPNNAYLIFGDPTELAGAARLDRGEQADELGPVVWMGRIDPRLKIDPSFSDDLLVGPGVQDVSIEIELINSPGTPAALQQISSFGVRPINSPRSFLDFTVVTVLAPVGRLLDIAGLNEVLFVGPAATPRLLDERSDQIVAGNLTSNGVMPVSPGYLTWLSSVGLNSPPDFIVDFSDTGLDRGSPTPTMLHPCFLDSTGASRVAYMFNYAQDGENDDRRGHGTLVASIAGGYPNVATEDPQNYLLGLGTAPTMQFGISRIFQSNGSLPVAFSYSAVAAAASAAGARISNNSWGQFTNSYDSIAQEYDSLVRDAEANTPGNQEMTFVFASGNFGPGGTVNSPGTAKNVITVGASQNYRPDSWDTCVFNNQPGIGPEGSSDAESIAAYSSGGPTNDGRAKPDLVAPGTHIYGAESQSPFYNAVGLCPGFPNYNPTGPQIYNMSSGTSLSTPEVTGAAALVRQYIEAHDMLGSGVAPSPAMIKAYLVNSTSYLSGDGAGGDLPGAEQGYGLVDLTTAFDNSKRVLVDQTTVFSEGGQSYQLQGSIADPTRPLRITLAWTDAPGTLIGAPWVNNLDLELNVGGTVYNGNNFAKGFSVKGGVADFRNNVESIVLPAGALPTDARGNFTITVRATNIAGDGVPGNGMDLDQDFALVVYNIGAPVVPPPPPPSITSVTYVQKVLTVTGANFDATATVKINGQTLPLTFTFNAGTNSLSVKAKRKKLDLNLKAPNQIVVVQGSASSPAFTLNL